MNDQPQKEQRVRSSGFRVIYSNALGLKAGDNDFQISLSVEHGGGENVYLEEAIVAITPRTAKLLWYVLGKAIEQTEKQFGEIDISEKTKGIQVEELKK